MGSVDHFAHRNCEAGGSGLGRIGLTDYNDLTHDFIREFNLRNHGDSRQPHCLFIDIEEGGEAMRLVARQGNHSHRIMRDRCACFGHGPCCARRPGAGDAGLCASFAVPPPDLAAASGDPYDLVMSCHSISFIGNARAACFLDHLRRSVRPGGMLFISAFGLYSVLGQDYPAENHPLADRFAPLARNESFQLAPETRLCLYRERDLCNTLFEAGWSVIRSSTTTENNVLATAIRV